ncbi:MAG: CsiV family protein [Thiohalomonadales bacterium]
MRRLNKISQIFLLFFLINNSIITTGFADEGDIRYYDVEIIIFENTRPKYLQSELWKKNYVQTEPETYVQIGQPLPIELPENYDPLLSFQYVENTNYRLNDIATNLNESKFHRILLHSAWRQPGMNKVDALNVKINHFIPAQNTDIGDTPINHNNLENNQSEQLKSESFNSDYETETINEKEGFVLSGYIKLVLSRYLHLKIDLIYRELRNEITEQFINDEFGEDDLLPDVFHILQTRRLRSKELHYIDHPVISVIALITPYKIKKQ